MRSTYKIISYDEHWEKYKVQYSLKFDNAAKEKKALKQFMKSRDTVVSAQVNSTDTAFIEVNGFAVYNKTEFKSRSMGLKPEKQPEIRSFFDKSMTRNTPPASFDARTIPGAVSFVRAQGNCGGCWAFSTVATLETIFYMKYQKTFKLSEQHLIDCDGFDDGCDGGTMAGGFNYIKSYQGVNSRGYYPYEDGRGICRAKIDYNRPLIIDDVKGFPSPQTEKPEIIEEMMKVAVAEHGAIAVGIDAEFMQFYGGGVYTGPCTIGVNHGVTLIGYGTDIENGLPYWIIKNSWGPRWGEAGFLRLYRGNNTCGIAQLPSVPILNDNIELSTITDDRNQVE